MNKKKSKEMKKINKMRVSLGLAPIIQKEKVCLGCREKFWAEDANSEYYCEKCKDIKKRMEKDRYEINGVVI